MKLPVLTVFMMYLFVSSEACSCIHSGSPESVAQAFFCSADFVIEGKILSDQLEPISDKPLQVYIKEKAAEQKDRWMPFTIFDYFEDIKYKVQIARVFKGNVTVGDNEVYTSPHDSMCGTTFSNGGDYIIFGSINEENKMKTGLCRGNFPAAYLDVNFINNIQCRSRPISHDLEMELMAELEPVQ